MKNLSLLIAIEGIDGSGKGTQASRLHAHLNATGYKAVLLSFPRYQQTTFGQKIGDFLNGQYGNLDSVHPLLVSLLFAGDRFESRELIEQSLAANDVVICDRYVASNIAHQGAKAPADERQTLIDWIEHLEYSLYRLPKPAITLFLDVPVATAQQLIATKAKRAYTDKAADLQEADGHYLQKVRDVYLGLTQAPGWQRIECTAAGQVKPLEDITRDIISRIESILPKK